MSLYEIIILSIALALDAMTVSFSYGLVINEKRYKIAFVMAFMFGIFQFIMPVIGWLLTGGVYQYIKGYSQWIVFSIFMFLALKFLFEFFFKKEEIEKNCVSFKCIFMLAIATSIDALGAGISIKLSDVSVIIPSIIIGVVTFILSYIGFEISSIFKKIKFDGVEIIAALLFIYLAIKSINLI